MSEYLIKEDVDNILKEYASKAWNDDWKPTHETVRGDTFIEACLIIDDMPTADVQPVVHCKDCKYAQNPNDTMVYCTYFECGTMSQNDFCSEGERRC